MIDWFESPESSTIVRVGYDDESSILIVEFKTTGIYNYFDVPQHIFESMRGSPSRGSFLAQNVKNMYRYSRT
ncbi:KTSC domain-containing protein [Shewanella sp. AS16]|uniref:KTSC domain-containing protein n=1 Tax=Shewanella sp. AS16 TaxID=2907625 RepID=UPI001F3ACF36|nr:KTSC domain-containing protein [Shewanella sp. AS16]MCE9686662.1 KTSC domain-containing protein [Shewanella sp. AS16]